jgi:hypothetical protein
MALLVAEVHLLEPPELVAFVQGAAEALHQP